MSRSQYLQRVVHLSLAAASIGLAAPSYAQQAAPEKSAGTLGAVIVTAQKREENLVDVPIAVSAFDSEALERKQIHQAKDLQFNIPNVAYTKTNFTSSNFQIRGIGVSSVGASSDSGVETHFNSVPLKNPRIFETEYFDVERVEVLRGPQGTLYGRNATGGAVNVLPKKPVMGEAQGNVEFELGNYSEKKLKAAVNLPAGDAFALRLAGIWYKRDGFTENLYTGNDVDGRDQWSARAALRFTPSDNTDITLTANTYKEDSSRARTLKQMCHRDPSAAYGCLPDMLAFETVNARATAGGNFGELWPLIFGFPAGYELIPLGTDINAAVINPADLRKVSAEFDPTYKADETIVTLEISHEFGNFIFTSITGFQETTLVAQTDYNWNAATGPYTGGGLAVFGGAIPLSDVTDPTYRGSLNGHVIGYSNRSVGYDQSDQDAHQWSQELRLASDFDGSINFQVGAFYFDSTEETNYLIATTELDYAAIMTQRQPPFYISATPAADLTSTALFGELYWKMTDRFKWTAGLRWTRDEKGIDDFGGLLAVPATAPWPTHRVDETSFEEYTGRFGFDLKTGWGDDSTLYAFYSRGYKAGGFNPPIDTANPAFAGTARVYDPEFVNSFEIGSKNVFAGGRVQANLSAFYYDYSGLQVSKIIARTSVNENINADIYGLEGEFVLTPVDNLVFDLNLAYLKTSIKDAQSVDPRDPRAGNTNYTVIKDAVTAANYILPNNQIAAATAAGCLMPLPAALGGPFGLYGGVPACAGLFGVQDGIATNLDGNQLPGSPEFSIKVGGQYTFDVGGDLAMTPRVDYYWRDDFYSRTFNRPIDKIEAWNVVNAQIELSAKDATWYVRAFVNNLMDDDSITGMYLTDASSGLFTNVFALDPRTYGVTFGARF